MKDIKNEARISLIYLMVAALFVFGSRGIASDIVERYYSQGLFRVGRMTFDHTLGYLPFSLFSLVLALLLIRLMVIWKKSRSLWRIFYLLIRFLAVLVILFYVLWGMNYRRIPLQERMVMIQEAPKLLTLEQYADYELVLLDSLNDQISDMRPWKSIEKSDQDVLKNSVRRVLYVLGYQPVGNPRIRSLPRGWFLSFSTSGMYNPLLGEGYIDSGVHPLQQAFVTAHELAHAFGVTGEGEANFIAFLACIESQHPKYSYSAHLTILRYLLHDIYRLDKQRYTHIKARLPTFIQTDFESIRQNNLQYPDLLPKWRDAIYSRYLRAQGISSGLRDYNAVVKYYLSWHLTGR